jgi:superfamily II DNA/RNA helicase
MIFCNTKNSAKDLQEHLIKQGIKAEKLTSDMQKVERDKIIDMFRK